MAGIGGASSPGWPRQIVWFGESTQSFWVASRNGLYEASNWDDLLAHLWAHTQVSLLRF